MWVLTGMLRAEGDTMAIDDELTSSDYGAVAPVGLPAPGEHPTPGGSPFPPISDYGFLSDCVVTALIASSGTVEWMCLPRMDGPSIFGAILDRGAGSFRLGPADVMVPAGRRYLPGTMILETTWGTPTGWAVVRDVLLMGPWRHESGRSPLYQRAPADHSAEPSRA
jgi:alpha,alpha-trehalase